MANMKLKSLNLNRGWDDRAPLTGEITYVGTRGEIKVHLTEQHVAKLLPVIADVLVESSKEIAEGLTADVIESSGSLLEAPKQDE